MKIVNFKFGMDQTFNTRAIILDRKDYREDDSRIIVYSEKKGKLNLIARGAKKMKSKLSGHIEPLILSRLMVIKGKEFDYVGTAKGEKFYPEIREDLSSLSWAGQALKAVDVFSREEEADSGEDVFNLLSDFLAILITIEPAKQKYFYWFFILKLLILSGFGPDLAQAKLPAEARLFLASYLEKPLKEADFSLLGDLASQEVVNFAEFSWKSHF